MSTPVLAGKEVRTGPATVRPYLLGPAGMASGMSSQSSSGTVNLGMEDMGSADLRPGGPASRAVLVPFSTA